MIMARFFIHMLSCFFVFIADATDSSVVDVLPEVAQTNKIGGLTVKQLVMQVDNVPTMTICFDEIIATNGNVVFSGTLSGIPGHDMVTSSRFLEAVLFCTVLSNDSSKKRFRFVSDREFVIEDCQPWSQVFADGKLLIRSDGETEFRLSYAGFASDAQTHIDKTEMDCTDKFRAVTRVKYHTRKFLGVRFTDRKYYPWAKDEFSFVNVNGDGCCKITIR